MAFVAGYRQLLFAVLFAIVLAAGLAQPCPGIAQQRHWLTMTDDILPQPDDPGTQQGADIQLYLDRLGETLDAEEVQAFFQAMKEELLHFHADCPELPTYLLDSPTVVSTWEGVAYAGRLLQSRSVRYWVQSCDSAFPMTVHLVRDGARSIRSIRGHPGFTLANLALQLDSVSHVKLTLAQMLDEPCNQEPWIYFTTVLAYAASPLVEDKMDVLEEWEVIACDGLYRMQVEFLNAPFGRVDFTFIPMPAR